MFDVVVKQLFGKENIPKDKVCVHVVRCVWCVCMLRYMACVHVVRCVCMLRYMACVHVVRCMVCACGEVCVVRYGLISDIVLIHIV